MIEFFIFCLIAFFIWSLTTIKQTNKPQNTARSAYQAKYNRLLNMVGGDKATCDRLIASYGIDRAIEDLIKDRR
jgi:hypothetical protein